MALALRLVGLDQSLFGDELFLYAIATREGLGAMLTAVHDTESTPPFHFMLAWAAGKLGDPTVSIRLPSLLLGTAAVPLTYLAGLRSLSRSAALLGAAFMALSPFAIFYAVEARAYATLVFLAALSTLALLLALQTRRTAWWALYALSSCLILYTHYTGVFLVGAQAAWAAVTHRDRARELLLAHAAIVVAYLPWLPSFLFQRHDTSANRISFFKSLTPEGSVRELVISFIGHPNLPLREVPGRPALVLLGLGAAAAMAGGVLRHWRPARRAAAADQGAATAARGEATARERRPTASEGPSALGLLTLAAVATPAGLALFTVLGQNVYIPRNLSASLPALCLLLGAGVAALRRPLAVAAAAAVLLALAIGTAKTLEARHARPPYRQAAAFIDANARPGDAVVEYPLFAAYANTGTNLPIQARRLNVSTLLGRHLDVHFERPRAFTQARGYEDTAWDRFAGRRGLFVVLPWDAAHRARPPLPPRLDRRFRLVHREVWQGLVPVAVFEYESTQQTTARPPRRR